MKLGLLGDIHGNPFALQAVLAAASSAGVDTLLITGDLVGYYHFPGRVLELLDDWDKRMVRGNHENMLARARRDPEFLTQVDKRYGSGIRVALEQLNPSQLEELCALPHPLALNIDGCKILLCHGSPEDENQYIYPDALPELFERGAAKGFDLVVLGHTHYPMRHQSENALWINPGSVGQPRNRQPGAHWAIFDTANQHLEFRTEPYDPSILIDECVRRHPEMPFLTEVLLRT